MRDDAVAFAIPNAAHRSKRTEQLKEEGVTAGVPDILIMRSGQALFLAMKKAKGGRVSPEQTASMARLTFAGAICAVASGLGLSIVQLEMWISFKLAGRLGLGFFNNNCDSIDPRETPTVTAAMHDDRYLRSAIKFVLADYNETIRWPYAEALCLFEVVSSLNAVPLIDAEWQEWRAHLPVSFGRSLPRYDRVRVTARAALL